MGANTFRGGEKSLIVGTGTNEGADNTNKAVKDFMV